MPVERTPERKAKHAAYMREYMRNLPAAHKKRHLEVQRARNKLRTKEQRAAEYKNREEAARNADYLKRYAITLTEYNEMLAAQGGVCAICSSTCYHRLSIDHCHATGRIRGLLCQKCNRGLGLFGDRPETLAKAIKYLGA